MRRFMWILLVLLVGCDSSSVPQPVTGTAGPIGLSVADIALGQVDGQETVVIAPVFQTPTGPRLASGLTVIDEVAPLDAGLTVATQAVSLEANYGVLRIIGRVANSPDGPTLIASSVKPLTPVPTTLADVTANAATYTGQVVAVQGTLIVKDQEALLVDAVGPGGVPLAAAAQVKVVQPFSDPTLLARLPNTSGAIRFGNVVAIGLMQRKALQIFWVELP